MSRSAVSFVLLEQNKFNDYGDDDDDTLGLELSRSIIVW